MERAVVVIVMERTVWVRKQLFSFLARIEIGQDVLKDNLLFAVVRGGVRIILRRSLHVSHRIIVRAVAIGAYY